MRSYVVPTGLPLLSHVFAVHENVPSEPSVPSGRVAVPDAPNTITKRGDPRPQSSLVTLGGA